MAEELSSKQAAIAAAQAADEKLSGSTEILDVGELMGICDFFVIASGSNPRQVRAIYEGVEEALKLRAAVKPIRIEGLPISNQNRDFIWVLMDYGDIVVHVFSDQARQYYRLDRLWGDCPRLDWSYV